jgi:prepilin-type N-terminal cleavage/methylation domain-containing protein
MYPMQKPFKMPCLMSLFPGGSNRRRLMKERRGFTILELLIVIAIIAILMALLLPALVAAKKRSREVGCATCVRNMKTALDNYYADWGGIYPIKPGNKGDVFNAGGGEPGYYNTTCVAQGIATTPAPTGTEDNSDLAWVLVINKYLTPNDTNFINAPSGKQDFVDFFKIPIVCRFLIEPAYDPFASAIVSDKLTQKVYIWSYGSTMTNWQNCTPSGFVNGSMPNYDGTKDMGGSEAYSIEAKPSPNDNNLTSWR